MAMLRRRRALYERGHVEDPPNPATQPADQVSSPAAGRPRQPQVSPKSYNSVYVDSRVMSASFKNNASFVSRLPTIRRHKSTSLHSPAPHSKPAHRYDVNASAENLGKPFQITFVLPLNTQLSGCSIVLNRNTKQKHCYLH